MPNKTVRIGCLWKKQKGNREFMTGNIETTAGVDRGIAVFKNDRKQSEKSPDYWIVLLPTQDPHQVKKPLTNSIKEEKIKNTENSED